MFKKFAVPALALLAVLAFMSPAPASAAVRFGVGVYAAPPVYSYPAPAYPAYSYPGYDSTPAYPYSYSPDYVYPSVGFGLGYGGYYGRGYYGRNYYSHGYSGRGYEGRGYYGGHGYSGGHRR